MRDYIPNQISIDGRNIPYRINTAHEYLKQKLEMTESEIEEFHEKRNHIYKRINHILAIKQAWFLLRRTSHSCGSLSEDLFSLKGELIRDLLHYEFFFDEEFVEMQGEPFKICQKCGVKFWHSYLDNKNSHGGPYTPDYKKDLDHEPS